MNAVDPIRDLDKFYEMQRLMILEGKVKECLIVIIMFNTNLRISDALLIKWRDLINDDGDVVDHLVISEKKTSNKKWIPMTEQLKEIITNYYIRYNPRRSSFVFRSVSNRIQGRNQPWRREYVARHMREYAARVGIKDKVGTHSCRKTWGYHAYNTKGIDIYEIMRILGHRDVRQTEVYCGIDSDRIRENYEMVSSINKRATGLMQYDLLPDIESVDKRGDRKKRDEN